MPRKERKKKKPERKPGERSRAKRHMVALRPETVEMLEALSKPHETYAEAFDRAVKALADASMSKQRGKRDAFKTGKSR